MKDDIFTPSHCVLLLGVAISLMAVIEAIATGKTIKERLIKCLTASLAISLVVIQAHINKTSRFESKAQLDAALLEQRSQITLALSTAFKTGTDQIILLAGQQADKTRKAANSQTNAIENQASVHLKEVQGATLGTTTCPEMGLGITRPTGRPKDLSIINLDKKLNMYDIQMTVTEFGLAGTSQILQERSVGIRVASPMRWVVIPFDFLSKTNEIELQVQMTTRATNCYAHIDALDTGGGVWVNDDVTVSGPNGIEIHSGEHLKPHPPVTKPDPR